MTGYAWTPPGGDGTNHTAQRSEYLLAAFFDEVCERHALTHGEIVMGGFSQGGMMTYRFGLQRPEMFAGLVILSGRVPSPDALSESLPEYRGQPIFVAHGTQDAMIGVADARRSRKFLESAGYSPQYHEYEMGHEINQEVLSDLDFVAGRPDAAAPYALRIPRRQLAKTENLRVYSLQTTHPRHDKGAWRW